MERLVETGAPIDGFGAGTRMGVSSDVIALADEEPRPAAASQGHGAWRRVDGASPSLEEIRARARGELERLPRGLFALRPAETPHPVSISTRLEAYAREVAAEATAQKTA